MHSERRARSNAARDHAARRLLPVVLSVAITLPGLTLRVSGAHAEPALAAVAFGFSVVGAAFLLAWAAEALQVDVSQGLALALLALIAVLPEYVVDFVFTWKAGKDPHQYAPLALANMTGGNRLLIGVGWSLVVLLAAWRIKRTAKARGYTGELDTDVHLDRTHAIEIGFLTVATIYSLTLPLKRTLTLVDAVVLVTLFVLYLARITRAPSGEPDLVGPAKLVGELPQRPRRIALALMFAFAAGAIFACADPFAESLVHTGERFGISTFLLVQWLAPLASEAPELIVGALFAWRLNTNAALGSLVSSKVNQWTLLVGTLPLVFMISSAGFHGLPLDAVQREELFLTAAQSAFAVAVLANRSISVREAWWLLVLFFSQFVLGAVLPHDLRALERIGVGVVYLVLAAGVLVRQGRSMLRLLNDGFRVPVRELARSDPELVGEVS
ncbi:MAG TPA: sodium:proton exchanger [Acidimicrobiia bacterium]|nr:sodium:proton exchanger [Acidimicrobiia bacterium]